MSAIRRVPLIVGLLAATAFVNGLTLATRNDRDVAGLGAAALNPFKDALIAIHRSFDRLRTVQRPIARNRRQMAGQER